MVGVLLWTAIAAGQAPVPEGENAETARAKEKDEPKKDAAPDWYNVHGQTTLIPQGDLPFHSPYQGAFSLDPSKKYRATATTTLFLGARLFENSEVYFNPELSAGGGIGNPTNGSVGFGGFPNGEATRTGAPLPTPYVARLFWKQTIGLGGEQEKIGEGVNALGGTVDVNRITLRFGKMSAGAPRRKSYVLSKSASEFAGSPNHSDQGGGVVPTVLPNRH